MTDFTKFLGDDAGAVTVDWVVLTAGVLVMAIIVTQLILQGGVRGLVANVSLTLEDMTTEVDPPP